MNRVSMKFVFMNFRYFICFITATVLLTSCYTSRIGHDFGGSWSPSKTGISITNGTQATFQGALFDSMQVVNVPQKEEHALSEKEICHSKIKNLNQRWLNRMTQFDKPEKQVSASFQKHKQQLKQKFQSFLPDRYSRWDYWLLFGIFALAILLAIGFITYAIYVNDRYGLYYAFGFLASIQSLVTFIALKSYKRMLKCGVIFGIGLWASVIFWWYLFIPVVLWLVISLLC